MAVQLEIGRTVLGRKNPCRKAVIKKWAAKRLTKTSLAAALISPSDFCPLRGRPLGPFEDREDTRCVPLPVA